MLLLRFQIFANNKGQFDKDKSPSAAVKILTFSPKSNNLHIRTARKQKILKRILMYQFFINYEVRDFTQFRLYNHDYSF